MSLDGDDDYSPKCLLCRKHREGQRYRFWGGTHMKTTEKRAFLSDTTYVKSEYRNMKRVGAFVCNNCTRRTIVIAALPTFFGFGTMAVACAVFAYFSSESSTSAMWGLVGLSLLFGLTSVCWLGSAFFPNMDSWTTDAIILDAVRPALVTQGKGNSFFTERAYDVLFANNPTTRPETAEEILGSVDDDDDDSPPTRKSKSKSPGTITRCPNCAKATPGRPAAKACKWCQTLLP